MGQCVGGGFGVGATVELENSAMSKSEFITCLDELARELVQLGFSEEADRAREIAGEVRLLRD
jgi:hypothetical protein